MIHISEIIMNFYSVTPTLFRNGTVVQKVTGSLFHGHNPKHGSRHRRAQMKFFGTKWKGGNTKI